MLITLVVAFILGLVASQTSTPQCAMSTVDQQNGLTLQFTPTMPVQKAPVSTVYETIMTSYLNVVDCNYVQVENVDDNPPQTGSFTEKTTVKVLVIYRVGCMPATTAVTQRDYRGYDAPKFVEARTALPLLDQGHLHSNGKRAQQQSHALTVLLNMAGHLATGIDPMSDNITVGEYRSLRQVNTALFAINLVGSGLDLEEVCQYLSDPAISERLDESFIDRSQAENIVCYASEHGLYFPGKTNAQLLADLAALEYAIQMETYDVHTLEGVCSQLDYSAVHFLGIDTEEIKNSICNGIAGITTTSGNSMPLTSAPAGTGNGQTTATPPYTTALATTTGTGSSIVLGTNGPVLSSATSAAGTVAPWFNTSTVITTEDALTVTVDALLARLETPAAARPLHNVPRLRRAELRRHGRDRL